MFHHKEGAPVKPAQLLAVMRKALVRVGEEPSSYGTHSFRIGAATEADTRGWGAMAIKELGRWSSDCFKGYVRNDGKRRGQS